MPPDFFINTAWIVAGEERFHRLFWRSIKRYHRVYGAFVYKLRLIARAAMGTGELHH
jgi:hypothetical protein